MHIFNFAKQCFISSIEIKPLQPLSLIMVTHLKIPLFRISHKSIPILQYSFQIQVAKFWTWEYPIKSFWQNISCTPHGVETELRTSQRQALWHSATTLVAGKKILASHKSSPGSVLIRLEIQELNRYWLQFKLCPVLYKLKHVTSFGYLQPVNMYYSIFQIRKWREIDTDPVMYCCNMFPHSDQILNKHTTVQWQWVTNKSSCFWSPFSSFYSTFTLLLLLTFTECLQDDRHWVISTLHILFSLNSHNSGRIIIINAIYRQGYWHLGD